MTSQTYSKTQLDSLLAGKAATNAIPTLAAVATTGAYADLTGTPVIPTSAAAIGADPAGTAAAAVAALVGGASAALDTLAEIDTQIAADEGSAAALAALVATKADAASVAATYATLTGLSSEATRAQNAEALKAPLASPAFTGTPTIAGTAVAKTTDITSAISALVNSAPGTLDTLGELATQLQSDETAAGALTTLVGTKIGLAQAAKNPDLLIVGSITRDNNGVITTAAVVWPDGTPGTFTTASIDASGAINGYSITYGSPVTKTYTQPTITRNAVGAATNVPQITVA